MGVAALVVLGVGLSSCKVPHCSDAVMEGITYRATVLEPYSQTGQFPGPDPIGRGDNPSCNARDGLVPGAAVALRMTGWDDGGNCATAVGRIVEAPAQVTLREPAQPGHRSAALLAAVSAVELPSCNGLWALEYLPAPGGASNPFAEPQAGQPPPLVLLRTFFPATGALPECRVCQDYFVVRVAPVSSTP
jgi:hypothetical protein